MSYGICDELARLSASYNPNQLIPKAWRTRSTVEERAKERYEIHYNPQMFALLLKELLVKEGVEILYDTRICDVVMEEDSIQSVSIENISGRQNIKADAFVDTTGDAVMFWMAEAKTINSAQKNKLAGWYYYTQGGKTRLRILGECDSVAKEHEEDDLSTIRYSGLNGKENSAFIRECHQLTLHDIRLHRQVDPCFEPVTIPTMPQLRMTRRFVGQYELAEHENDTYFEDSIGMIGDWRKAGMRYEIPFRTLYTSKIRNLVGAGRCISVSDDMWDITRVIPACAVTGEAAGLAASMTENIPEVNYKQLQEKLQVNGQKLHLNEEIR